MLLNIQLKCLNNFKELKSIYFLVFSHQLLILQSVSINMNCACGAFKESAWLAALLYLCCMPPLRLLLLLLLQLNSAFEWQSSPVKMSINCEKRFMCQCWAVRWQPHELPSCCQAAAAKWICNCNSHEYLQYLQQQVQFVSTSRSTSAFASSTASQSILSVAN